MSVKLVDKALLLAAKDDLCVQHGARIMRANSEVKP
jgi:hypothetical protein